MFFLRKLKSSCPHNTSRSDSSSRLLLVARKGFLSSSPRLGAELLLTLKIVIAGRTFWCYWLGSGNVKEMYHAFNGPPPSFKAPMVIFAWMDEPWSCSFFRSMTRRYVNTRIFLLVLLLEDPVKYLVLPNVTLYFMLLWVLPPKLVPFNKKSSNVTYGHFLHSHFCFICYILSLRGSLTFLVLLF